MHGRVGRPVAPRGPTPPAGAVKGRSSDRSAASRGPRSRATRLRTRRRRLVAVVRPTSARPQPAALALPSTGNCATLLCRITLGMARDSAIEWTAHTFNPWWGCTKVSPACDHCYAETWARRTGFDVWGADAPRRHLSDDYWNQPLRWDRDAAQSGRRVRVFCASMADVFEWDRALDALRERLWTLIEGTPNLDWLLLTKRPHLARRLAPWSTAWPLHVWLGTTVENQHFADRRIRFLIDVPCRYRFLSCEPLLGPVDLSAYLHGLHWVIAGGESGGRARPTHPGLDSGTPRPMRGRSRRISL